MKSKVLKARTSAHQPIVTAARCESRSVNNFLHAKKVAPIEIHRQLEELSGQKCMDTKNVRKRCREFSAGRTTRSATEETVWRVEELLLEDRRH